jgi:hypothetical protein
MYEVHQTTLPGAALLGHLIGDPELASIVAIGSHHILMDHISFAQTLIAQLAREIQ